MHTDTDSNLDTNEVTDTPKQTPSQDNSKEKELPEKKSSSIRSFIFFALLVLVIVLPIRLYVAKPFIVSGTSMYPTFNSWHYLIIDQLTYKFHPPQRGDVIVFRFPQNPSRFFIKRIIGLPNETVKIKGSDVTIINATHKKGFVLNEPYVLPENRKNDNMTIKLTGDEYFVMGDNRKASADSRYWGPLEYYRIVGRVYLRLFPFSDFGILPGKATYNINNKK